MNVAMCLCGWERERQSLKIPNPRSSLNSKLRMECLTSVTLFIRTLTTRWSGHSLVVSDLGLASCLQSLTSEMMFCRVWWVYHSSLVFGKSRIQCHVSSVSLLAWTVLLRERHDRLLAQHSQFTNYLLSCHCTLCLELLRASFNKYM